MVDETGRFGEILMNLAVDFINIPPKELELGIDRALRITGEFTGVDRSYTFLYDFDRGVCNNTHEWCREGIEPMIDVLQDVPLAGLDDWMKAHRNGEIMHIPWVEDLEATSALREILEPQGIQTMVAVPLFYDSQCLGFVGFDAVLHRKQWSQGELVLLRLLAEIFTNAEIGRRRVVALDQARKNAESAERLLRRAVEAGKAAIWETDEKNEWLHCFSGWVGLLGEDIDNSWIPLADFYARIHPDDLERVLSQVAEAAQSPDKLLQINFRVRHRDSRWIPVLARGLFEYDGQGRLVRISGSTVDVTETLREMDQARRRLEMDSKLLLVSSRFVDVDCFDSAVDAALRDVGKFCEACRADLYILEPGVRSMSKTHEWCAPGISPQVLTRTNLPFAVSPSSILKLEEGEVICFPDVHAMDPEREDVKLLKSQLVRSLIAVPLMVGGRLEGFLALECTTAAREWPAEDVVMLRGFAEVVAGALTRTRAELAIRSSESRHRTILNSLQEAVFMTDEAGVITYVNHSWKSVTGIANESAIGRTLADMLKLRDRRDEQAKLKVLLSGEPIARYVIQIPSHEIHGRWLSLRRLPWTDARGGRNGTLGSIMDVSEQRVWEENLISAKIQAESANEAKTLYLSNLSHELRTPMHGVIGMLELIMEQKLSDEQQIAHASDARSSAMALLRLLDDILDIAKGERGLIKLEEKPVDLKAVVQSVAGMFAADSAKKSLSFSCEIDPSIPSIFLTDELRCRQITGNILKNAIAYTDAGSVAVRLFHPSDPGVEAGLERQIVRIEVRDTGIGIAAEKLPNIFKPFVQLSDSSHKNGGSGLGLAIVHEIVQLMHGVISIESVQGQGTTVRVDLPLTPSGKGVSANSPPDPRRQVKGSLKGLRVLVAEDNEINRIVAREHLEEFGCVVRTAIHGREAVTACQEEAFDVVLMDCLMPEMDGFDASRLILERADPNKRPAIIGCTANASEQTTAMCIAAGMRSVLSKPYTRVQLVHELESSVLEADDAREEKSPPLCPVDLNRQVLDPSILETFDCHMGGGRTFSSRLIQVYVEKSPEQIAAIHSAIAARDLEWMRNAGHSFKGATSALGLTRLDELCKMISHFESMGDELSVEEIARIDELSVWLEIEQAEALKALEAYRSGVPS